MKEDNKSNEATTLPTDDTSVNGDEMPALPHAEGTNNTESQDDNNETSNGTDPLPERTNDDLAAWTESIYADHTSAQTDATTTNTDPFVIYQQTIAEQDNLEASINGTTNMNQDQYIRTLELQNLELRRLNGALLSNTRRSNNIDTISDERPSLRRSSRISETNNDSSSEGSNSMSSDGKKSTGKKRKSPPNNALTKQEKKKLRGKSTDHSISALGREEKRFVIDWLPYQPRPQGLPTEWPQGNQELSEEEREGVTRDIHQMISDVKKLGTKPNPTGTMPNPIEVRMRSTSDIAHWKTIRELIGLLIMSTMKIKDGIRPEEYDSEYCLVCKAAGNLDEMAGHVCPYCIICFYRSGYRKKFLLLGNCNCSLTKKKAAPKKKTKKKKPKKKGTCDVCGEDSHASSACPYCALCIEGGEGRLHRGNCNCDKKPAAK